MCVALVSRHNSAVQPPAVLGEFGHVLGDLIGDGGDVDGQHHGHGPEGNRPHNLLEQQVDNAMIA